MVLQTLLSLVPALQSSDAGSELANAISNEKADNACFESYPPVVKGRSLMFFIEATKLPWGRDSLSPDRISADPLALAIQRSVKRCITQISKELGNQNSKLSLYLDPSKCNWDRFVAYCSSDLSVMHNEYVVSYFKFLHCTPFYTYDSDATSSKTVDFTNFSIYTKFFYNYFLTVCFGAFGRTELMSKRDFAQYVKMEFSSIVSSTAPFFIPTISSIPYLISQNDPTHFVAGIPDELAVLVRSFNYDKVNTSVNRMPEEYPQNNEVYKGLAGRILFDLHSTNAEETIKIISNYKENDKTNPNNFKSNREFPPFVDSSVTFYSSTIDDIKIACNLDNYPNSSDVVNPEFAALRNFMISRMKPYVSVLNNGGNLPVVDPSLPVYRNTLRIFPNTKVQFNPSGKGLGSEAFQFASDNGNFKLDAISNMSPAELKSFILANSPRNVEDWNVFLLAYFNDYKSDYNIPELKSLDSKKNYALPALSSKKLEPYLTIDTNGHWAIDTKKAPKYLKDIFDNMCSTFYREDNGHRIFKLITELTGEEIDYDSRPPLRYVNVNAVDPTPPPKDVSTLEAYFRRINNALNELVAEFISHANALSKLGDVSVETNTSTNSSIDLDYKLVDKTLTGVLNSLSVNQEQIRLIHDFAAALVNTEEYAENDVLNKIVLELGRFDSDDEEVLDEAVDYIMSPEMGVLADILHNMTPTPVTTSSNSSNVHRLYINFYSTLSHIIYYFSGQSAYQRKHHTKCDYFISRDAPIKTKAAWFPSVSNFAVATMPALEERLRRVIDGDEEAFKSLKTYTNMLLQEISMNNFAQQKSCLHFDYHNAFAAEHISVSPTPGLADVLNLALPIYQEMFAFCDKNQPLFDTSELDFAQSNSSIAVNDSSNFSSLDIIMHLRSGLVASKAPNAAKNSSSKDSGSAEKSGAPKFTVALSNINIIVK